MRCFLGMNWKTLLCLALACQATAAYAEHPAGHALNSAGRWLGYGWSRGYHTNDNVAPHTPWIANSPMEFQPKENSFHLESNHLLDVENVQPQSAKPSVLSPANRLPAPQPAPAKVPEIQTPPLPSKPRATMPPIPSADEVEQKGNMSRRVRNYFQRAERYPIYEMR